MFVVITCDLHFGFSIFFPETVIFPVFLETMMLILLKLKKLKQC